MPFVIMFQIPSPRVIFSGSPEVSKGLKLSQWKNARRLEAAEQTKD